MRWFTEGDRREEVVRYVISVNLFAYQFIAFPEMSWVFYARCGGHIDQPNRKWAYLPLPKHHERKSTDPDILY